MKKVTREVKSKGEVVDTITVPQYETVEEAVKVEGKEKILGYVNKVVSDNATNQARAAKVRPSTPQAKLTRLAKTDPRVQKEIDALVAKYSAKED